MTVQEANEYLKQLFEEVEQYRAMGTVEEIKKKIQTELPYMSLAQARFKSELDEYRNIGTVEELKEAREKQVAKKVIGIKAKLITRHCPSCQEWAVFELKRGMKFCPSCGQALDWSEEDD